MLVKFYATNHSVIVCFSVFQTVLQVFINYFLLVPPNLHLERIIESDFPCPRNPKCRITISEKGVEGGTWMDEGFKPRTLLLSSIICRYEMVINNKIVLFVSNIVTVTVAVSFMSVLLHGRQTE
jgi:hypothetical protein